MLIVLNLVLLVFQLKYIIKTKIDINKLKKYINNKNNHSWRIPFSQKIEAIKKEIDEYLLKKDYMTDVTFNRIIANNCEGIHFGAVKMIKKEVEKAYNIQFIKIPISFNVILTKKIQK